MKRRTGVYTTKLGTGKDGPQEVFTRIDAQRVVFVLKNDRELRVTLTKGKLELEVYSSYGTLIVRPQVSNVVTLGTEDR